MASLKDELASYHERLETARDSAQQAQQAQQTAAVAESRTQAQADKADGLKSQVADLKTELSESRKEAKAAHQATAGEAEKWRETVALEHKRNAELQSERDNLAERLAALEAEKKEQKDG